VASDVRSFYDFLVDRQVLRTSPFASYLDEPPPSNDLIEEWLTQYENQQTRRVYRQQVARFFGWCAAYDNDGANPATETVATYLTARGEARSRGTAAQTEVALRSFFRFLVSSGRIPASPLPSAQIFTSPQPFVPHTLTSDELRALIAAAAEQPPRNADLPVVLLMGLHGLSMSEVHEANVADLGRRDGFTLLRVPRRRRHDIVALSASAADALAAHRRGRSTEALVMSRTGDRITPDAVLRILHRLSKDIGLHARVNARALRATTIALGLAAGATPPALSYAVGGMDRRTFELLTSFDPKRYEHHVGVLLERAVLGRYDAETPAAQLERLLTEAVHPVASILLAAAFLENHLRAFCQPRHIAPDGDSIMDFASALKTAGHLPARVFRELERWNDIRNEAAHGLSLQSATIVEAQEFVRWTVAFLSSGIQRKADPRAPKPRRR
jgi:integrase/recombinase XerD